MAATWELEERIKKLEEQVSQYQDTMLAMQSLIENKKYMIGIVRPIIDEAPKPLLDFFDHCSLTIKNESEKTNKFRKQCGLPELPDFPKEEEDPT